MSYASNFGFRGWLAATSVLVPGMPSQCDAIHRPPGAGGSAFDAGASGAAAGTGATAGSAGESALGGSGGSTTGAGTDAGARCSPSAAPICGNGCIEAGEECDDGAGNGPQQPCDANCFRACNGRPIRVDPAASTDGSGRDWEHPANQIQSAVDRQVARGGGEVWIIGGDFDLAAVDGQPGLTIPSNIALRGGFAASGPPRVTRLRGARNAPLLTIVSSTAVRVQDLSLADGDAPFVVQNSHDVILRNVTVEFHDEYTNNALRVEGSELRLEQCNVALPLVGFGLVMTGSDVTISNSTFDSPTMTGSLSPKLSVDSSRLFVQDSLVNFGVVVGETSQALILDSALPNTHAPGAALLVNGSAAAVGTEFGEGYGDGSVHVDGEALIFDSSFTGSVTAVHGMYPVAWAIVGTGSLDVSLSSFLGGACIYPRNTPCPAIESGMMNNSFFVYDESAGPVYVGSNYDPQTLVTLDGVMQPSNCTVAASRGEYGNSRLNGPYPCTDQGDAAQLSASQARLLQYVAPFTEPPFNADLGQYMNYEFWRSEAVTTGACGDVDAPDPGRHFQCTP